LGFERIGGGRLTSVSADKTPTTTTVADDLPPELPH
jgi:hypothetical protein